MRYAIHAALGCTLLVSQLSAAPKQEPKVDEATSNVGVIPAKRIAAISRQIDELVEQQLETNELKPNPVVDDETFVRRVYLDIVGRIPTLDEVTRFLKSRERNKRRELIDELLDSPGYVSHQYNFWADLLRLKTRLQGGNPGRPYINFIKESLAANKPYDEMVHELLNSEGPILDGNGATGYYLRDTGMPEDNMANTVRIFLGTRIECAQCHDHPFDKWTQKEFFEMVAFNGGVRTRLTPNGMSMGGAMSVRRQLQKSDAPNEVKQQAINLLRPLSYGVAGGGTGLAKLPDSYQYDDGKPNEIVKAKTMFGEEELVHPTIPVSRNSKRRRKRPNRRDAATQIPGAKDIGSREVFADWITSPDNPRFTMVIANRLWKEAMGLGLVEPVDDITDDTVAANEELLEFLSRQMIDLDYDTKQFYRAIYNSKTYQREASDVIAEELGDTDYHFPGPIVRRMSAEQLWDSFLTLAVPDLDTRKNPRDQLANGYRSGVAEDIAELQSMSADDVLKLAEERIKRRNDPEQKQKIRKVMMKANGTKYQAEARNIQQRITRLKRLQQMAKRRKNGDAARNLQNQIKELQVQLRHLPTRVGGDLVRASELPSPAPAGHFLREFGQSDRDQIENANSEPAVNQVLSLMNGQIEKRIISNPRTVLMRNATQAGSLGEKIDTIFLSILSRKPTRSEKKTWLEIAREEGAPAANDLIWTLANTGEFMFVK